MIDQLAHDAIELARTASATVDRRAVGRALLTNDSYQILALHRGRELAWRVGLPVVSHVLRRVQTAVYGIEIGCEVTLGSGVYFVHPVGITIGGDARIGDRVRFYGNNTVGTAREDGYPTLEDDVIVGAGARILGPVTVGRGALIGANAVVITDIPAGGVAVGMPARVVSLRESRP